MDKELNLDFLVERRTFHISSFMYKVQKGLVRSMTISHLFEPITNVHGLNTRAAGRSDLIVPITCTQYGLKSIVVFGSKIWNLLPITLRECKTIESFTRNYWKIYDRISGVFQSWISLTYLTMAIWPFDLIVFKNISCYWTNYLTK